MTCHRFAAFAENAAVLARIPSLNPVASEAFASIDVTNYRQTLLSLGSEWLPQQTVVSTGAGVATEVPAAVVSETAK